MPLLSIWKLLLPASVIALSACSSEPRFSATGYVADNGIMRIWRLDNSRGEPQTLVSVYSPLQGDATQISTYTYRYGLLSQIQQNFSGKEKSTRQLHLDEKGAVSFMQYLYSDRAEPLSKDDIALMEYQAKHILEISDALIKGKVKLVQGRWANGQFISCSGKQQILPLDAQQQQWIAKRAAKSRYPLGIAWIDSPKGTQLLIAANEDVCRWEPKSKDL